MSRYVALLRGINVGGNNLIKMTALKACFEENGLQEVATFIQSGNVIFDSPETRPGELVRKIEAMLAATFKYPATIVLCSRKQMRDVVEKAPAGFGKQPARYRYDVLFLKAPLKASAAIKDVPTREGVDQVHAGTGVLYFSRLISQITKSQVNRIVGTPLYKSLTIRNWNTTTKLQQLMEAG
jgi:uncharacterized protein (DUF1697 family)